MTLPERLRKILTKISFIDKKVGQYLIEYSNIFKKEFGIFIVICR